MTSSLFPPHTQQAVSLPSPLWGAPEQLPAHLGQAGQQRPFVVDGLVSGFGHSVGKHQTSLHAGMALCFPPYFPEAPWATGTTLTFGLMQYGQQWPSTFVDVKPLGHV